MPKMAPIKVAVLPLVNKEGQPERAREIYEELRELMPAEFDTGGSIGKRYRRQDEIGTPWGVTVDHQTMEDGTVTLRDRDTLEQVRLADRRSSRRAGAPARGAVDLAEAGLAPSPESGAVDSPVQREVVSLLTSQRTQGEPMATQVATLTGSRIRVADEALEAFGPDCEVRP